MLYQCFELERNTTRSFVSRQKRRHTILPAQMDLDLLSGFLRDNDGRFFPLIPRSLRLGKDPTLRKRPGWHCRVEPMGERHSSENSGPGTRNIWVWGLEVRDVGALSWKCALFGVSDSMLCGLTAYDVVNRLHPHCLAHRIWANRQAAKIRERPGKDIYAVVSWGRHRHTRIFVSLMGQFWPQNQHLPIRLRFLEHQLRIRHTRRELRRDDGQSNQSPGKESSSRQRNPEMLIWKGLF